MAENLNKKPNKGILKNSSSFDIQDNASHSQRERKATKGGAKWDEMNILATLHPPDKDYGHMKIDEPNTPYNYEGLDLDIDTVDANELAQRLKAASKQKPKALQSDHDSDEDEDEDLTPEQRAAKREFEQKRRKHYNEYYAVKLAKKLLETDEEDDDDKGSKKSSASSGTKKKT